MKLLILTQKVDINDDVLGFFHNWILEFAKHCEKLTVICLEKGKYSLPENVKVLSLGKENSSSVIPAKARIQKLQYTLNFYKYIFQERKNYDKVFVHMNPEYVVLGGLFWRLWGKKAGLWYVHKTVDLKLKIAEILAHVIFTASLESFRLKSKKVKVVGHGIKKIKNQKLVPDSDRVSKIKNQKFHIIYVGRISKIKNQKLLINAIDVLVNHKKLKNLEVKLIGAPVYKEDKIYLEKLKNLVKEFNLEKHIKFIGSVPYKNIGDYYNQADLSINLCPTGGIDKAVLESLAYGVPAVILNKSFENILGDYKEELVLGKEDEKKLANKIENIINLGKEAEQKIGEDLRLVIRKKYSLKELIEKIVKNLLNY